MSHRSHVEHGPGHTRPDRRNHRSRIQRERFHVRKIDDDGTIGSRHAEEAIPVSGSTDLEIQLNGTPDRSLHLLSIQGKKDRRWISLVSEVEGLTRIVVHPAVGRHDHLGGAAIL